MPYLLDETHPTGSWWVRQLESRRAIRRPARPPPRLLAIEPKNIPIGTIPCEEIEPMRFEIAGHTVRSTACKQRFAF